MHKHVFGLATVAIVMFVVNAASAVSFVGSLANNPNTFEIGRWSRTSVVKTFDIDGNNFYGTDGFTWMNEGNSGAKQAVLANLVESAPSYFTGGIAYTGVGSGASGSFSGSENRLNPTDTGVANVGYVGVDLPSGDAGILVLQEAFSYTMVRDMLGGETIRMGIVLDSLADPQIGADALRVVAGGGMADATIVAGSRNASMDMYFFDITGLAQGDDIEIWVSNATVSTAGFNAATIGGVTFDSVINIPEPATSLLIMFAAGMTLKRRRHLA